MLEFYDQTVRIFEFNNRGDHKSEHEIVSNTAALLDTKK